MGTMSDHYPAASTIGFGLVLTDDDTVQVVLMLGSDEEGLDPLAAISLQGGSLDIVIERLQVLARDLVVAQEAVSTMGRDSAREYLTNWQKRINSDNN